MKSVIQFSTAAIFAASIACLSDDTPGSVDLTFNPAEGVTEGSHEIASANYLRLASQRDKVWVYGNYEVDLPFYTRLNKDGSRDDDFRSARLGFFVVLGTQSDGSAIVWGNTLLDDDDEPALAKVAPDGSTTQLAKLPNPWDTSIISGAIQPDDKIVAVIQDHSGATDTRWSLCRFTARGLSDQNFQQVWFTLREHARAIAFQPDGGILWGGYEHDKLSGEATPKLIRLHSDGSLDSGFHISLSAYSETGSVDSLSVQADGKIVVAGHFLTSGPPVYTNLVRLNPDGSRDQTFRRQAVPADEFSTLAVQQEDGKLILASVGEDSIVSRVYSDGSLDQTFGPVMVDGSVRQMLFQAEDKLLIAGWFWAVNGVQRSNIARLHVGVPSRLTLLISIDDSIPNLTLNTTPATACILEASTDLHAWRPLQTNTVTTSSLQFRDEAAISHRATFYRAIAVP